MLQTIQKVAHVLDLFSLTQPEWTVGDVARVLALPKSSTSELLSSMAGQGLLQRAGTGRYRLGWRFLELGQTLMQTTEFHAEARPVMRELVAHWGETSHLAILDAGQVVYVEKLQGPYALPIAVSGVGVRLPAYCSGVGKVLLAHHPWEEVARLTEQQGMQAFTAQTLATPQALAIALEQVRQSGVAYDVEEIVPGLCCVAAPIYDIDGKVIAGLSLSLPARDFYQYRERYTADVREAAQRVSINLGYRVPAPRLASPRRMAQPSAVTAYQA